jgi:hypothetical protein
MSRRPRARHTTCRLTLLPPLLLATLSVPATRLLAQTPTQKIQDFAGTASGYTLWPDLEEGALGAGRQMAFTVELLVGGDYMVVGFCDDDCTDLNLAVLDPLGEEMESDELPDPQPILMVEPELRGMYQIRVDMVECAVEPCGFAVGILEGEIFQNPLLPEQTMEDRMDLFRSELAGQSFTEVGPPESGTLEENQEVRFSLSLLEGLEYKLAGACDNDCENLDLVLLDPLGREVASDLLSDPIPLLTVTPTVSGEYQMAVRMVTCTIEPCGFAVSSFVRGGITGAEGATITGNIVMQETHQGTLEVGDERLPEGEFFDEYSVRAESGQTIILDLRSPDFDTYLILEGPEGEVERNDDWEDNTMHSHIEAVAPVTGTYLVRVSTFLAEEVGEYTLQVALVEGS